jgi:hypothetical protein
MRFFLLAIRSAVSHYGNRLTVMRICEYLNIARVGGAAQQRRCYVPQVIYKTRIEFINVNSLKIVTNRQLPACFSLRKVAVYIIFQIVQ